MSVETILMSPQGVFLRKKLRLATNISVFFSVSPTSQPDSSKINF